MKPFRAQMQIGDGPPISVTVDEIVLKERPFAGLAGRLLSRADLTLEFDLTPEFAAWWEAVNTALAGSEEGEERPHAYVSTACQHEFHVGCRKTCKFCEQGCRCWCHSTCAHVVPYLVSDDCEMCGRTPEEMVADPARMRRENAELRREAAIKKRQQEGGEPQ